METSSSTPPVSSTQTREESESIKKAMQVEGGDKEDATVSSTTSTTTDSTDPTTAATTADAVSTPGIIKPPETAKEKLEHVWNHIVENGGTTTETTQKTKIEWPSYNDVFQDIRKSDYNEMLTCPVDIQSSRKRPKQICAQGMVCCAKLELFDFPNKVIKGRPYSGLLKPGTVVEDCLIRFSSALQPMNNTSDDKKKRTSNRMMSKMMFGKKLADAQLFPAIAMKIFRSQADTESANILFLGCKVGQCEDDFFAHALCTQLTSRMPATLKPILKVFTKYSQFPLALGLSGLCMYDVDGTMCDDLNFPFCLTINPCYSKWKNDYDNDNIDDGYDHQHDVSSISGPAAPSSSSTFLDDLQRIPIGTVLYDLYASPTPLSVSDPTKLQRIGRIVSTSEMKYSPGGDGLWFRHQRKDEDFQLRPHWKDDLGTPVTLRDGTNGTASTLAGWELFEDQIKTGDYIDFESPSKSPSLL